MNQTTIVKKLPWCSRYAHGWWISVAPQKGAMGIFMISCSKVHPPQFGFSWWFENSNFSENMTIICPCPFSVSLHLIHAKSKNQLKLLSMWYYLVFASSFSDADDNKEEFYNADPKTPVFEWSTKRGQYNIEQLSRILVFEDVEPQKVCSGTPSNISHNVTFVVNLEEVGGLGDLKADEMGVWNRQGAPKAYISIRQKEGSKKEVIRRQKTMDLPHHYTITRTYYRSGSSPDLQKLIVTVEGE